MSDEAADTPTPQAAHVRTDSLLQRVIGALSPWGNSGKPKAPPPKEQVKREAEEGDPDEVRTALGGDRWPREWRQGRLSSRGNRAGACRAKRRAACMSAAPRAWFPSPRG